MGVSLRFRFYWVFIERHSAILTYLPAHVKWVGAVILHSAVSDRSLLYYIQEFICGRRAGDAAIRLAEVTAYF